MIQKEKKSLVRFLVVGVINTAVDFIVFSIFNSIFVAGYILSQIFGYSAGILNSFIMNKLWTFENKSSRADTSIQFIKFVAVNGVSLLVSILGMKFLKEYMGYGDYVSKVIITPVVQVINFLGYRLLVFIK